MKEYEVVITEMLQKTVTIEAESLADARKKVDLGWIRGEYMLDAENFVGVTFEPKHDSPQVYVTYQELTRRFREAEKQGKHLKGYIVFTADSFPKPYTAFERTYVVSSDNKAFQSGQGGYSISGSSLDGEDVCVRLDRLMADEYGGKDGFKIERCYMLLDEVDRTEPPPKPPASKER